MKDSRLKYLVILDIIIGAAIVVLAVLVLHRQAESRKAVEEAGEEAEITETVEVNKHAVGIGGDVVALPIGEVKNHVALFVQGLVVTPLPCNEFQFPAVVLDIAGELLAVLIARGMEVDKEVNDGCKEVLGGVLEERLTAAFLFATTFVEG